MAGTVDNPHISQRNPALPPASEDSQNDQGLFGRLSQRWKNYLLLKRIASFEALELKTFVSQKLFKIDSILCDEQTRANLIEKLVGDPTCISNDFEREEMIKKYGGRMVKWVQNRLLGLMSDWDELVKFAAEDFQEFRLRDPLCNWYRGSPEATLHVVQRIEKIAENMSNKVRWSILIEPGKLTCHLMDYVSEFSRLEAFFVNNELSFEEADQSTFNQNYLKKARNSTIACPEMSRVKLRDAPRDQKGDACSNDTRSRRIRLVKEIFNSDQVPEAASDDQTYGTTDFIHANYIRGGTLRNTFICTEAPLAETQEDFWRMIYQEKCGLIFMLCTAVEGTTLGLLEHLDTVGESNIGTTQMNDARNKFCPFYWPRNDQDELVFGNLIVKNCGVDSAKDPLFNVTCLEVWRIDDTRREEVLSLEHWQWDWTTQVDVHWPFRLLRRARTSPTPTVVHCIDGASRTGALITLEVVLMHLLSGFPYEANPVLTSAVFVRLQRRGAISTPLLYLWVYRCLLHWVSPFVSGWRTRLSLGLVYSSTGFISKYNEYLLTIICKLALSETFDENSRCLMAENSTGVNDYVDRITSEEIVVINSNLLVAIIIISISIFGISANLMSIYLASTYPQLKNNFGALCISQCLANTGLLIIFLFWCAPITLTNAQDLSVGFWGKLMGQLNTLFWDNCVYSHLVVSLNRLVTITFPTKSVHMSGRKSTVLLVGCSWTIAAILNTPYFIREYCYIVYKPITFTWNYADGDCGLIIGTYLDCYLGMTVFGIISFFDVYTIVKLRFTTKKNIAGAGMKDTLSKRRALEIRFFAQSCAQLLIFAYIFASFYFVSTFFVSKWALFFTVTFSWQICHALDGCVLLLFHWRRQTVQNTNRLGGQTMIQVRETGKSRPLATAAQIRGSSMLKYL
ncbi:unnamed protein product, partial [Mesorhabditis belari]|uniref:Uncharacterized protein n=1 Tax=Mesorhabditis belari TaxID=2138241 RepID=A0AAF3ETV3_9BILA